MKSRKAASCLYLARPIPQVGTDPFSNTRGNAAQDGTERKIRETVARPRALKGSGQPPSNGNIETSDSSRSGSVITETYNWYIA